MKDLLFPPGWEWSFKWFLGSWLIGFDIVLAVLIVLIETSDWLDRRKKRKHKTRHIPLP